MFKIRFKRKTTSIILFIVLILILSYYLGLSGFSNKYLTLVTNPMIKSANYISASLADFISLYLGRRDLQKKNDELSHDLIDLAKKNVELRLLKDENNFLRKELEFLDDYEYKYLIARVIGSNLNSPASQILIDKGFSSGLRPGLPVTTDQGVIIGKITKVESNISHVQFLIDNQNKLSVLVMGEESALGMAQGQHNINLKVDMLPKDISISLGDWVASSGLDLDIPPGLIIGRISKIDKVEEKFWQEAMVEPAVDYNKIRWVTVILPTSD